MRVEGRTGKGDVAVVDEDEVAVLAELRAVKVDDHLASLGEADELLAVDAMRVVQRARAVDDCGGEASVSFSAAKKGDERRYALVMVLSFESKISSAQTPPSQPTLHTI